MTAEALLPSVPPKHMSFSQATTLLGCGEQYRLSRVFKVPEPPGWALIGGKAHHQSTQLFDLAFEDLRAGGHRSAEGVVQCEHDTASETSGAGDGPRDREGGHPSSDSVRSLEVELEEASEQLASSVLESGTEASEAHLAEVSKLALQLQVLQTTESVDAEALPLERWKVSGRASKTWPEKENAAWWEHHLPLFLRDWVNWRLNSGYRMAYLPGKDASGNVNMTPAIELDVSADLGGIRIVAYLDRVMLHKDTGEPVVLDLKTSSREPTDFTQLALYAALLEAAGIAKPALGAFWMSRKGEEGTVHSLEAFGREYFEYKFGILKEMRDRGLYLANDKFQYCGSCSVKQYCYQVGGEKAHLVPKPWEQNHN